MTSNEAQRLTQAIREAVSAHDEAGFRQWYIDELCIDCDADEFWRITEAALAKALEDAPELHQLRQHADHDHRVAAVERERIFRGHQERMGFAHVVCCLNEIAQRG